jgi:hypothetical protein
VQETYAISLSEMRFHEDGTGASRACLPLRSDIGLPIAEVFTLPAHAHPAGKSPENAQLQPGSQRHLGGERHRPCGYSARDFK